MLEDTLRTGLVVDGEIVDLTDPGSGLPGDMAALLALGEEALAGVLRAQTTGARRVPLGTADLTAPVTRPPPFLGIARNHDAHLRELGHERPEFQTWFSVQPTCGIDPCRAVVVPRVSSTVDYEGELSMVIGRRCRHVPAGRALEVVAGYKVVNDVSVQERQWWTPTMMMGKGFGTHGPSGPWIVTTEDVGELSSPVADEPAAGDPGDTAR